MEMKPLPDIERVKELLDYDPKTGVFTWKINRGKVKAGDVAGSKYANGYRRIGIDGTEYLAARLAWFYVTGEDPGEMYMQNQNKDNSDLSINNLKRADWCQVMGDSRPRGDQPKGVKAVGTKFVAVIQANLERYHLGCFQTIEEATAAYKAAERILRSDQGRFA